MEVTSARERRTKMDPVTWNPVHVIFSHCIVNSKKQLTTFLLLHINRKHNTHIKFVLQPEECGQTGVSGHCALCRVAMVKSRELGLVKAALNVMELTIPNLLSKKQHVTMVHAQVIILFNSNAVTKKY